MWSKCRSTDRVTCGIRRKAVSIFIDPKINHIILRSVTSRNATSKGLETKERPLEPALHNSQQAILYIEDTMSRSEDDERTPLVYEDRVGASSDIETDGGHRRRRRYICIALTTVCLGVGLVLAVALPLTMSQGQASSNPVSLLANSVLQLTRMSGESMTTQGSNEFTDDQSTVTVFTSTSSSSSASPSTSPSSSSPSSSNTSSASTVFSAPSPTPSPHGPFASCQGVPNGRRSAIDLEQLNGKLLFELYRVQTRNSPGYASGLSCSVMELDFGTSTNASQSKEGTMRLKWMESGFISRYPRAVDVHLERSQESSPYDWTETVGDQSDAQGRLSFLVQIDGYLLTYECFPNVSHYPSPAYAIHLYSLLPWTGNTYVATSLITLANIWGLNPAEQHLTPVSHRFCLLYNALS